MAFTPPAGNAVELKLSGAYTPPAGNFVPMVLADPEPELPPFLGVDLARTFGASWDAGVRCDADRSAHWGATQRRDASPAIRWTAGDVRDLRIASGWSENERVERPTGIAWDQGSPRDRAIAAASQFSPAKDHPLAITWNWAESRDAARGLQYSSPPPKDGAVEVSWGWADGHDRSYGAPFSSPPPKDIRKTIPWGWASELRHEYLEIPPPLPPPSRPPCWAPVGNQVPLRLRGDYTPPPGNQVPLRLSCVGVREYRVLRTLIMEHTVTVCRLPDRTPLKVAGVTLAGSGDSWAWTVDLDIVDRASFHLVMPTGAGPKLVEVNVSGHIWTALIERANERRVAPQDGRATPTRFSAGGRSRSATLAAPYAAARPYIAPAPTTAAQAAERELEFSGFTLDWQIDDWEIPAGVWNYENETNLSAILRIAASAGAIVQSHMEDETIIVKPAYPAWPWNWADQTPSVLIDGQSLTEMGREWRPGPQYLGVFVKGETQGLLVGVTRDGSAGSPFAQMIVDPLICALEPARGRGGREIADSENQTIEPIVLPLVPAPAEPGVILPAELVQVTDPVHGIYKALVSSVSIRAEQVNGAVSVRQTVQLARHYPVDLT